MGNSNSIKRYNGHEFVRGDQVKYLKNNKNYIFIHYFTKYPTMDERKEHNLFDRADYLLPDRHVFVKVMDENRKLINIHICSDRQISYIRRYDCILSKINNYFIKNSYEIAKKIGEFRINDIKNYDQQIFIEIDGIYDVGDGVYDIHTKKCGIVTDVLENGRAKVVLVYNNIPKYLPYATAIKEE